MPRPSPMPRRFELESAFADLLDESPDDARALFDATATGTDYDVDAIDEAVASTVRERGGWR